MNREQRRAQKRRERQQRNPAPLYKGMTHQEKLDALVKNGITIKDLEKNFEEGYHAGFADAAPGTFKTIYAAICLVLNEKYGFGRKRCCDVLTAVDRCVTDHLTSAETIEEVWQRIGLMLDFNDGIDRIKESE